jgi:glycerol-3-phosphate dehydrogenase
MQADAIIIGGGATGCGIAWDLSLRGAKVILVERSGLGAGTTGRYHGLLHSGARYAVSDPDTARECARESVTVRRIAAPAVNDTGGFFVLAPGDDAGYVDPWVRACTAAGIHVRDIPRAEALSREPGLDPGITLAFEVPDAVCNAFSLCSLLARGAEARGAAIMTHHGLEDFLREGRRVVGARLKDLRTGASLELRSRLSIIAAGPWSAQLAGRAGASMSLSLARGSMLAFEGLLVRRVVNRLQPPGDGDIMLPRGTVSIAGTTIIPTEDPDDSTVSEWETNRIREQISMLLPGVAVMKTKHSWAGVRPLYDVEISNGPRRDPHLWSRDFSVLDHAASDGIDGLITIAGGKLTTFRLMAEHAADAASRTLGITEPCRTATTPLK